MFVQRSEGGEIAAFGPCGAQIGPLLGIRSGHVDSSSLLLHVGGSLVGLHMVFDRPFGCRQRRPVQLAMEVGQRDPVAVRLRLVKSKQFT